MKRRAYLGSITTDWYNPTNPEAKTTLRTPLYWDGTHIVADLKGKDIDTETGKFNTFEDAADAALSAWRGPAWDFRASQAVSNLFGGIIRPN